MNNETQTMAELQVQIAENMPLVYAAGLRKGLESNEEEAFEEGRKSQYDEFWDEYQNPAFSDHDSRFAGRGWSDATFKPKYNIPNGIDWYTSFSKMFANCSITDLAKAMGDREFDFTWVTRCDLMFYWANNMTHIPALDLSNVANCNEMFNTATSLVTIDEIKVSPTTNLNNAFFDCKSLENINVIGEIAYNGISFAQSPRLTKASITSIIEALQKSGSGKTLTLSQTAVNNAFTTTEWNNLRASKSNWTISLV